MTGRTATITVLGPWSPHTSRRFWERFAPAALSPSSPRDDDAVLRTIFRVDAEWSAATAEVSAGTPQP